MSKQYPGGLITKTPVTPSGPYSDSTAPGIWTLDQQAYWQEQGQWPTQGSVDPSLFIENLFSTYLYTGNGSTQTITNGIDLSGKGGMVWLKSRSLSAVHTLVDTARGAGKTLFSDLTNAQATNNAVSAFNANGFTMGDYNNSSGDTFVSWTFRKQPKFFDVVTWTGTGSNRTIAHNLDSVPGCIIVKRTDTTAAWAIYHRSLTSAAYSVPFSVLTPTSTPTVWNSTAPTSTVFSVGTDATVNASGGTYVAYIYAHDAGGFGLLSTDNVISCGSFTTNGAGAATVNLGYEPQWILMKRTNDYDNWYLIDNMRGWLANTTSNCQLGLYANSSGAEAAGFNGALQLTSTGFIAGINTDSTFIYIAIRRGPMKVPTSGTSVYNSVAGAAGGITTGIVTDTGFIGQRSGSDKYYWSSRLTGYFFLNTTSTAAQDGSQLGALTWDRMNGFWNNDLTTYQGWGLQRAPSFHDVVCYTGTGSATTFSHNLAVVPELMITKRRSNTGPWVVYTATTGNTDYLQLYTTDAVQTNTDYYNSTTPTASVFTLGSSTSTNATAQTFVAYLFATCPGVSKVGTYTGTGAAQTINCGFTAGSRFVLIKRTDSTGDWYFWDSARGIIPSNDPYLLINSTAAEVTGTDYVDTTSVGFDITSTAPAAINANGGTFIFLAIA